MATVLRRNRWYSRLVIPLDLRPVIGRCEVLKSLRAEHLPDVKLKATLWEGQWQRIFNHVRKVQPTMTTDQLQPYVQRFIAERLAEWEHAWFTDGETPAANALGTNEDEDGPVSWQDSLALFADGEIYTTALRNNDLSIAKSVAADFLARYQLPVEPGSVTYCVVCRELLKAEQAIDKAIRERVQGTYENAHTSHVTPAALQTITLPTKLFSEVSVAYLTEHKTRQPRTQSMIRSSFLSFLRVIGGDRPVGTITKDHCRAYKESMVKAGLAATTTTKHLHSLQHFLTWAKGQGFIPEHVPDPVKGLKIAKAIQRKGAQKRALFTSAELHQIFSSSGFLSQRTTHPERYWLVLLCVFEGCRREEAGQLEVCQVVTDPTSGVLYLNITDEGEGQGLKNAASKRRVPLHADLLALGFMDYVEQIRHEGHARLFPQLTHGGNGYGDAVGKYFNRLIRQLGIADRGKVLYSFRHMFITQLHAADVADQLVYTLTGHAGGHSGDAHQGYVHRESFPLLVRWVAWTPNGYYDAPQDGEGLIGWHLNRGKDAAAEFYDVSHFHTQFYRPDLLQQILRNASPDTVVVEQPGSKAVAEMSIAMLPSVKFLAPLNDMQVDQDEMEIVLQANDVGSGIQDVRLYQNAKSIAVSPRGVVVTSTPESNKFHRTQHRVKLIPGVNNFRAVATNKGGAQGHSAELSIRYTPSGNDQRPKQSTLHVLAVGIDLYSNPDLNLNFARRDAQEIAKYFKEAMPPLFSEVRPSLLLDHEATKTGLLKRLQSLRNSVSQDDVVMIYLSGHGYGEKGMWYFGPHELQALQPDEFKKKGLSSQELLTEIRQIKALKLVLFIDSCQSGSVLASFAHNDVSSLPAFRDFSDSGGFHLVTAATATQNALEVEALGHGIFTDGLLKGLSGNANAPPEDDDITVRELANYVSNYVRSTSGKYAITQVPVAFTYGLDFPLTLMRRSLATGNHSDLPIGPYE